MKRESFLRLPATSPRSPQPRRSHPGKHMEALDRRLLLHSGPLQVLGVVADNRGEILITLNQPIRPSNVNTGTIQMYTGGPDGIVGNQDDERVTTMLNYQAASNRIVIRADLPAGTGYRVKLVSTRMETADGHERLDGEFRGVFPSGNGVQGGNFEFQVKNDRTSTPLVRMSTSAGVLTLRMRSDAAPRTVHNFLTYSNTKQYDNIFFTRNVPGFVIQGGSLQINEKGGIIETAVRPPVVNEFNISNTRGTVAMAKQGGDPNSATNQFFFNLGDNSANLDNQNGGFTVFAQVTNSAGLAVMDAVAAKPTADLTTQMGPFQATGVTDVPVNDAAQAEAALDPARDLVIIRRTATLMRVVRL